MLANGTRDESHGDVLALEAPYPRPASRISHFASRHTFKNRNVITKRCVSVTSGGIGSRLIQSQSGLTRLPLKVHQATLDGVVGFGGSLLKDGSRPTKVIRRHGRRLNRVIHGTARQR